MPNHVITRCSVTGPFVDVERFRDTVIRVPEGEQKITLDFDQITPMPKIVKESTHSIEVAVGVQILSRTPDWSILELSFKKRGITTIEQFRAWAEQQYPKAIEEGRKALEVHRETGFFDWYHWSMGNWGSDSNSYSFKFDHEAPGELCFHFVTARDFPVPIFEKLAQMFPTLRFDCTCFEEMWNFAGHGSFNGDKPFELVEATKELYEVVYGCKPEYEDEHAEEGEPTLVTN